MDWFAPFRPAGPVNLIAAKNTNLSATNIGGPASGDVAFIAINPSGAPDVFLFYGPTSTQVVSGVVPAIGAFGPVVPPAGCGVFHMPGGSIQAFTLTGQTPYVAAATQLGSCTISLTPGAGV